MTTSTEGIAECASNVSGTDHTFFLDWKHYCTLLAFQSIDLSKSGPVFHFLCVITMPNSETKGLHTPNESLPWRKLFFLPYFLPYYFLII